jgi:hypothetical protein
MNEPQRISDGPGRCTSNGCCSDCAGPTRCEACHAPIAHDEPHIFDADDDGIVYCSDDCRDEFVATAERDGDGWMPECDDTKPVIGGTVG